jgi:hypothetical protein
MTCRFHIAVTLCSIASSLPAIAFIGVEWEQVLGTQLGNRYAAGAFSGALGTELNPMFADTDGDGDLDVYLHATAIDQCAFYENLGTPRNPVWAPPTTNALPFLTADMDRGTFVDVDGDGDLDFFAVRPSAIDCFLNEGTPVSASYAVVPDPFLSIPATTHDFIAVALVNIDDDNDLELFASAYDPAGVEVEGELLLYDATGVTNAPWSSPTSELSLFDLYQYTPMAGGGNEAWAADLEFVDANGDSLQDLVLGVLISIPNVAYNSLLLLTNIGTVADAVWSEKEEEVFVFGSGYYPFAGIASGDLDADADTDLFIGSLLGASYLRNEGSPTNRFWHIPDPNFLAIDFLQSSRPQFSDIDSDGDQDLFVVHRFVDPSTEEFDAVTFFENQGTPGAPVWAEPTRDFLSYKGTPEFSDPGIADIDDDDDFDFFIGKQDGTITFISNTGTVTDAEWLEVSINYAAIDVGFWATPAFADLDDDGDPDLFAGSEIGHLFYYENTGTPANAAWAGADTNYLDLSGIGPTVLQTTPVFLDSDRDGDQDLVVVYRDEMYLTETTAFKMVFFENTGTVALAQWRDPLALPPLIEPNLPVPAYADLDGDGDQDVMLGDGDGGLSLFRNNTPTLIVQPVNLTLAQGQQLTLGVSNAAGAVTWSFLENLSGGSIVSTAGVYTAGTTSSVDVIEVVDALGVAGRAFVNVIDPADLTIAGKAIIVAGAKSAADPVWKATDRIAQKAYNVLRLKGYAKENIRYLSFETGTDVDGNGLDDDIDGPSTLAAVTDAIGTFAQDTDELFVYLANHGSDTSGQGFLRLNASENLSATQLDGLLDSLQSTTTAEVAVAMDFCYAGSFLDEMDYPGPSNRVVIASCGTDELTYFIAGGLVSFSEMFFGGLLQGLDLEAAFRLARGGMSAYQNAEMDDNHDGVFDPDLDGTYARTRTIGASFSAGRDLPQIGRVNAVQEVDGSGPVTLWATDIASVYPVTRVWCIVVPPNHNPDSAVGNPVIDLPELDLFFNPGLDRYEVDFSGFTEPGTYSVIYFAEDIWGGVSFPKQSYITQQGFTEKIVLFSGEPVETSGTAVQSLANSAFSAFRSRLFAQENIQFLATGEHDADGDGTNDVDAADSLANLESAIKTWAAGADKLSVYLVGNASNNQLRATGGQALDAATLNAWLDAFQTSNQQVNVMMEFSGAGSFLNALFRPDKERILLATSSANRRSVISDGISFTSFFLSELLRGLTLGDAVTQARRAIRRASGNIRQRVLIDDSRNGIPNEKDLDGAIARNRYIGTAFITGDDIPNIGSVTPATVITGTVPVELWAADVTDVDGIDEAWCEITSPTNYLGDASVRIDLAFDLADDRWEATYSDFDLPGLYTATFFASDTQSNTSPKVQTTILQTDTNDLVMSPPALPDKFEPDDVYTNATYGDLPIVQYHTLHLSNDCDWIQFYADAQFVYDIETVHLDEGTIDTVLEIYSEGPPGVLTLIDRVDEFGTEEGELAGLDFPTNGFYFARVCQADDNEHAPGGYLFAVYVPAGLQGINVIANDVLSGTPLVGAQINIRNFIGLLLASQSMDASGIVNFPQFSPGFYRVEVVAPDAGYVTWFDQQNPENQANNANSAYGNPRWITANDFGTVAHQGQVFLQTTMLGFYFLPVARVDGHVTDTVFVQPRPVENAFISLVRSSDSAVFDRFPWAVYGTVWWSSAAGEFPGDVFILPQENYVLYVQKDGYAPWIFNVDNPTRGQVIELGMIDLLPNDGNSNSIPDPWELEFYNALISGIEDTDADGHNEIQEYFAGTVPTNDASLFRMLDASPSGGSDVTLTWSVESNRIYAVHSTTGISADVWIQESGPTPSCCGQPDMNWTDTNSAAKPTKQYRVEVSMP